LEYRGLRPTRLPDGRDLAALAKVELLTTVWPVISARSIWQWAVASNEHAVANARTAATECSRHRLERAEVEQFLAAHAATSESILEQPVRVSAGGR
jgi:hypothetical protein